MKPEAAYALLRDKFPTAPLAPPGAAWRRLTQVRTWGAHRRGARREGQGLYSQPREDSTRFTYLENYDQQQHKLLIQTCDFAPSRPFAYLSINNVFFSFLT